MIIPPTSTADYAKYIRAKHERMMDKYNHPFPPETAVRALHVCLSDGQSHAKADLFA